MMKSKSEQGKRPLSIYIHIPFCIKKCAYCDFLSGPAGPEVRESYVDALCREIEAFAPYQDEYEAVSVFFGGGTPTVLEGSQLARIMECVKAVFSHIRADAEVTCECNPGTLSKEKLDKMKKAGFNRLSIGIQSADNDELKLLGRIHTWEEGMESFHLARACGFDNINLDLISALPGQTPEGWRRTLEKAAALGPEHISAYSLIIEEGTLFYERYADEDARRQKGEECKNHLLPGEEEEQQMTRDTISVLSGMGYSRYEISNYARKGYESIHNTGYWTRREYAGFGTGAASLLKNKRIKNISELNSYIKIWGGKGKTEEEPDPGRRKGAEEIITLSLQNEMEETMFLGLRMTEGVSLDRFEASFGKKTEDIYKAPLLKYIGEGLMVKENGFVHLTPAGMDVSNIIMADFLL